MKPHLLALLTILCTLVALPAFALELHQARTSGMVGEKFDGYVTALKPSPEVTALVAEVNVKRTHEYARISKENGQPIDVVAKLAAEQIITKLEPGSPYQSTDGSWKTR